MRTKLPSNALAALAQAGAFDSFLGADNGQERRREALWTVLREGRIPTEGLDRFGGPEQIQVQFEPPTQTERIVQDYRFTGLSTEGHPMEIVRPDLNARGILTAEAVGAVPNGEWVKTAGMVICRQRPGTAKGYMFLSLEDETGILNVIVPPKLFDRYRQVIVSSTFLELHGVAQIEGSLIQLRARRFYPLNDGGVRVRSYDFH